jgi:hypothetical protein
MVGLTSELSYMTAEQATAARELEVELLADAAAGCDLRVRLIGAACSAEGALSPVHAARGRIMAKVLTAGRDGVQLSALVLGPDSRRAVGQLIGEGRLLVCADRVVRRGRATKGRLQ